MTAPTPDRSDLSRDQFTNDYSYYLATGRHAAPAPEQMRVLATKLLATADWVRDEMPDLAEEMEDGVIALRSAADQLEAVHDVDRIASAIKAYKDSSRGPSWNEFRGDPPMRADYDTARCIVAALTADTAPQEDRDAK